MRQRGKQAAKQPGKQGVGVAVLAGVVGLAGFFLLARRSPLPLPGDGPDLVVVGDPTIT